jgi:hypothetical protein
MAFVWILTETIMDYLHTRVNLWDHDLNVYVFTSEQRANNHLKGLKLLKKPELLKRLEMDSDAEINDSELDDSESDNDGYETRWFIKKHPLNPKTSMDGEHYDTDSLVEKNPKKEKYKRTPL